MKVFIQARTSSSRLQGKVLKNIIDEKHTLDLITSKLLTLFSKKRLVILTSNDKSDDLIQNYCREKKINYFRGSLKNVSKRFVEALKIHKCKYFMRISADSPLIDVRIIKELVKYSKKKNLILSQMLIQDLFQKDNQ